MHIDFADKSTSKSISPKVSKYQFDTLNCSLEELAVLERIAQNPTIKQQELVSATGKPIVTMNRITTSRLFALINLRYSLLRYFLLNCIILAE